MNDISNSSNITTPSPKRNLPPMMPFFYRSQAAVIAQITSLVILGILTFLGNLASIVTFAKTQSLRRRSNYMIINLSIADFSVSIAIFMAAYFFSLEPFNQPYHLKVALELVDTSTGAASLVGLTMISVERFYAVVFPFKHRMLRFKHHLTMCLAPWLVAAVIFFTYVGLDFPTPQNAKKQEIYMIVSFSFLFLSLIIMLFSYFGIWLKSRQVNPSAQNQNRTARDKKVFVTLLIVTLASLSTWLPLQCFTFALLVLRSLSPPHFNYFFAMKFLQFLNSAINFFIYMLRMRDFREGFLAIFCCKRERSKPSHSTTSVQEQTSTNTLSLNFINKKAYAINNDVRATEGGLEANGLQLKVLTIKNSENTIKIK